MNKPISDDMGFFLSMRICIYLEDDLARNGVQDLARQAMKVCVGDRTFDDNIIGTARDALRACIDDELSDRRRREYPAERSTGTRQRK